MNAGTLTDIIEIWRKTNQRNEYGEKTTEYALHKTIRASVEHRLGTRTVENDEIWHGYSKTFKVRLHTDVREEDKIFYDGSFYIVQSIDTDKHRQTITIMTEKINE